MRPFYRPCFFPLPTLVVVVSPTTTTIMAGTGSIVMFCLLNFANFVLTFHHSLFVGQQGIRDGAYQSQSVRAGQCGGPVQNQETYPAAETDERLLRPSCEYIYDNH